jgi:L-fuconolactonase
MSEAPRFIDAHLHVWDPAMLDYEWLKAAPELSRKFLPEDLPAAHGRRAGMVFVQADCAPEQGIAEVDWALGQPWTGLCAVVAFAPLELGDGLGSHLEALADRPLVKGVRRLLQDCDPAFITAAPTIAGARAVAEAGLVFDACIRWHQLGALTRFAQRLPELPIVLDHMGKPPIAGGALAEWREELRNLARLENVSVKLSGAAPEAAAGRPLAEQALPYLGETLSLFGADRCMLGSDWPVSNQTDGQYMAWVDLVLGPALVGASAEERTSVAARTAARFYGFEADLPHGRTD